MSKRCYQLLVNTLEDYKLDANPETPADVGYILACNDIIEVLKEEMEDYPEAQPGMIEPHDDPDITADAVLRGYDFCIGDDGRLYALISGDQGWCSTHIVLRPEMVHEEFIKKIAVAEESDQVANQEE